MNKKQLTQSIKMHSDLVIKTRKSTVTVQIKMVQTEEQYRLVLPKLRSIASRLAAGGKISVQDYAILKSAEPFMVMDKVTMNYTQEV